MGWETLKPGTFGASVSAPGVDANLVWADASRFIDFRRSGEAAVQTVPVIVRLKAANLVVALHRELSVYKGWVPAIYQQQDTLHCTAMLPAACCRQVLSDPYSKLGSMIESFDLQLPVIPQRPRPVEAFEVGSGQGHARRSDAGRHLIGVIDSGCPFAHWQLRDSLGSGTRVLNLWDQDFSPALQAAGGVTPPDIGYGIELSRQRLNALMAAAADGRTISEDACYQQAGYLDLQPRFTHGSSVLSLLAGRSTLGARMAENPESAPSWKQAVDPASQADIAFVQLSRDAVQDSSSAGMQRLLLDGLRYILSCAGAYTERIVVNISNGSSRSTHDGNAIIERAFAELVAEQRALRRDLHIVLAAGNSYAEQRHAQIDRLTKGERKRLTFKLPAGNETSSFVVVRLPNAAQVRLRAWPVGNAAPADADFVQPGEAKGWPTADAPLAAVVLPAFGTGVASAGLLAFAPSTGDRFGAGAARPGYWRIELEALGDVTEPVHFHVTRNQPNPGSLGRGSQGQFVDVEGVYDAARYLRRDVVDASPPRSPIRRLGSLSSVATGAPEQGVWVVGSYVVRSGVSSTYSSAGPAAGVRPARVGPDASAATDESAALQGIRGAGSRSGQSVRIAGTSFAAPQVARMLLNEGALRDLQPPVDPYRNGAGNLPLNP